MKRSQRGSRLARKNPQNCTQADLEKLEALIAKKKKEIEDLLAYKSKVSQAIERKQKFQIAEAVQQAIDQNQLSPEDLQKWISKLDIPANSAKTPTSQKTTKADISQSNSKKKERNPIDFSDKKVPLAAFKRKQ